MPKIDLLPCPFCGSPAKLCSSKANAAGTRFVFWVHCDFRGDLNCDVIPTTPKFDTAEQAVNAWNTRASGWIPCSVKKPEADKSVLVVIKDNGRYTWINIGETDEYGNWMIGGEFWYSKSDTSITHWMPTPELPKGES